MDSSLQVTGKYCALSEVTQKRQDSSWKVIVSY